MRAPLLSALAIGAACASACVSETGNAVFIEGVIVPEEDCTISGQATLFRPSGIMDLGATSAYQAPVKVRTNLPATFSGVDVAQSRTQSPSFPNYGGADNNVVAFESAELSYEFNVDAATQALLLNTARDNAIPGELECSDGRCTLGEREGVANGVVFNTQTQLNGSAAIPTDMIPGDLGASLLQLFQLAAPNVNNSVPPAQQENVLQLPGLTHRLLVRVTLHGKTTGQSEVTSPPFLFPIELCVGCLDPSAALCDGFDAQPVNLGGGCVRGVDVASGVCACTDPVTGDPTNVIVSTDPDVCG